MVGWKSTMINVVLANVNSHLTIFFIKKEVFLKLFANNNIRGRFYD